MTPDTPVFVNFDEIQRGPMPAVVKALAAQLESAGYLSTGKWLSELSEIDLNMLLTMVDDVDEDDAPGINNPMTILLLIAILLAQGEGADVTENSVGEIANSLMTTVVLESLRRKGLVEFDLATASIVSDFTIKRVD